MLRTKPMMVFLVSLMSFHISLADLNNPWDIFADMELRASKCSNHVNDTKNISTITDKIHIFGTWKGEFKGDKVTAILGQDTQGRYKARADVDGGSSYGPFNIKICDENGTFYGVILGYKARFEVFSKTKMRIYSPLNENEFADLTRQ